MSGSTAPRKPDSSPLEANPHVSVPLAQRQEHPSFQSSSRNQSESHDEYTYPQDVQRHSTYPTVFNKLKSHGLSQVRRAQTGFDQQSPAPSRSVWFQVSDIGRGFKARHGNPKNFRPAQNPRRQSTINTKYSLPFEKTRAWDQKAILSLDGGGIRGYSALLIIRELMRKVQQVEESWRDGINPWEGPAHSSYYPADPVQTKSMDSRSDTHPAEDSATAISLSMFLPCHYFDYMAGTSTGGLIGIMLGRLRMSIDDCIEEYETLGGKVFGRSRWFHLRSIPPFWLPREKYNHETLESVIQSLIERRIPKIGSFPGGKTFAFDENRCRVVVVAYQENTQSEAEKTYLFRTYKNLKPVSMSLPRNPGPAHDIPILEVARATSAAPGYFKEVKIDGLKYLDGGFGANNPCLEIFREVRNLNNYDERCIGCVMSIGTGKNDERRIQSRTGFRDVFKTGLGKFIHYENFARKWASDSENVHESMVDHWEGSNQMFKYFRLNVDNGLARMKLDEWKCRGSTRVTFGRCIGWIKRKNSKDKSSRLSNDNHEEKTRKDIDSQSDQSSFAQPAHWAPETSEIKSLDELAPSLLRPYNKTLATIRNQTELYLSKPESQAWLQECAEYLVKNRREKVEADLDRWQKTCFGTWYQCQVRGCQRGQQEYSDTRAMEKHLLDKHGNLFSKDEQGFERLRMTVKRYKITVH